MSSMMPETNTGNVKSSGKAKGKSAAPIMTNEQLSRSVKIAKRDTAFRAANPGSDWIRVGVILHTDANLYLVYRKSGTDFTATACTVGGFDAFNVVRTWEEKWISLA